MTEKQKLEHLNLINSIHKFDKSTYLNLSNVSANQQSSFFFKLASNSIIGIYARTNV